MLDGFIKVAAGVPKIRVGDCRFNAEACFTLMREAHRRGVAVLVLPELCLTGATCGDLFLQDTLLDGALSGLQTIFDATHTLQGMVTVLGLPMRRGGRLCSCAAVVQGGALLGVVEKSCLSQSERRWFSPSSERQPLFSCNDIPNLVLGVTFGGEIQPEATVVLNLSAGRELVGLAAAQRTAISASSRSLSCAMVCAAAGEGESTTDGVFAGHSLIAENGAILAERRFVTGLTISEVDVQRLAYQRRRTPPDASDCNAPTIPFAMTMCETELTRRFSPTPFIPEDDLLCRERCDEILLLSALGLKTRLEHTGAKTCVVGLSGGLDSTLAVLITALALRLSDRPASDILAVTMPCFGTTDRTRDNAVLLARQLGATLRHIDISASVRSHFGDIGQNPNLHDVTYENAQARERTQVLMDLANQTSGLVIGTGDLSELALGFCTYSGDHMSSYAVCAGIPKTLVRRLVSWVSLDKQGEDDALSAVLDDILDTPVSPELLPAIEGNIAQKTEDLVGSYELHDFFLYYALRWGFSPRKILRLAERAFVGVYRREVILKWETVFFGRLFSQQFKRSCLPDGPQVGSVTLSPRGGLVMPSDGVSALWRAELEELR